MRKQFLSILTLSVLFMSAFILPTNASVLNDFDPEYYYINYNDISSDIDGLGDFTFQSWIKTSSIVDLTPSNSILGSSNLELRFTRNNYIDENNWDFQLQLLVRSNSFFTANENVYFQILNSPFINDEWTQISVVYHATGGSGGGGCGDFYLNGVIVDNCLDIGYQNPSGGYLFAVDDDFRFGFSQRVGFDSRQFLGNIANARLFSYALTGPQISSTYNSDLPNWNNVIFDIPFYDNINDFSNNSFSLSQTGSPTITTENPYIVNYTLNICGDGNIADGEICDDGVNNGTLGYCNNICSGIINSTMQFSPPDVLTSIVDSGVTVTVNTTENVVTKYFGYILAFIIIFSLIVWIKKSSQTGSK